MPVCSVCHNTCDTEMSSSGQFICSWCRVIGPVPTLATEKDPHGADPHTPGAKLDQGKVEAGLLADFGPGLMAVAQVCTFGAKKYTRRGWLTVPEAERRYMDAAWRHLLQSGTDKDSGLDHLSHAAWNLLAVLTLKATANAPR